MRRSMKGIRLVLLVLLAGVLMVAVQPANAAEIRQGDQIVIEEGEVIDDDLLVSAESVIVNGRVTGDLLAGGAHIVVNGVVEGSAVLTGQDVTVNGEIDGSLYSASYLLNLGESASIGRNMYYGGYALNTAPGSVVNQSVYVGGYQMLHAGQIGRDLVVGLSALALDGAVGGDVRGTVSVDPNAVSPTMFMPAGMLPAVKAVEPGLALSETAVVGGVMRAQETVAATPAPEPAPRGFLGLPDRFTNRLGEFIGLMIVGALIIYGLPLFLPTLSDEMQEKPLFSLGLGLLMAFIVLPLAILVGITLVAALTAFLGFVTFGELTAAALTLSSSFLGFLLVAYLFAAYVITKILVGYWGGRYLLSRTSIDPVSKWTQLAYLALGLAIFEVLRAIPFFGFALAAVVMFFGVGAMLAYALDWRRGVVPAPSKPVPATGD